MINTFHMNPWMYLGLIPLPIIIPIIWYYLNINENIKIYYV